MCPTLSHQRLLKTRPLRIRVNPAPTRSKISTVPTRFEAANVPAFAVARRVRCIFRAAVVLKLAVGSRAAGVFGPEEKSIVCEVVETDVLYHFHRTQGVRFEAGIGDAGVGEGWWEEKEQRGEC